MSRKHRITAADILPAAEYALARADWRKKMTAVKRLRRVEVGPFVTFYFESFDTMWHQIQEMLFIEKGGPAQIPDELAAYNPLVPNGRELTATFMIEIDDPVRRKNVLARLGGIEETAFITIGSETVQAQAEADQDRTTEAGKASAVQFVHFPFTPAQVLAFRAPGAQAILGMGHPNYSHMAVIPEAIRAELMRDFD
jgi:hypothetical protein